MTPVRVSYLIFGTLFLSIGTAGLWGVEIAIWGLPVAMVGLGVWGLVLATRSARNKDARPVPEAGEIPADDRSQDSLRD